MCGISEIREFCFTAIVDVISDELAFPVNRLRTSVLVYVVDLSAFLAFADVVSDELAFPVN